MTRARHKTSLRSALPRWAPGGVLLCALAVLSLGDVDHVRADIWECQGADGTRHYTNAQQTGGRCRRVVRSPQAREQTGSSGSSRPAMAGAEQFRRPANADHRSRDPRRYRQFDAHIREASRLYQLPESFIRAVVRVESDFNPNVVSRAGAMGMMQLMPATARNMGVRDPFDPRQNILGGTRYLRILANTFNGDLVLTVAGYNAGEGAVMRYRGVPPYAETRRYVQRVLRHYYAYRSGRVERSR